MRQSPTTETTTPITTRLLWALRVGVLLHTAMLAWEFVTAGRLISQDFAALPLHSWGAIVLHVAAGLQLVAAVLYWRPGGGRVWPAVLSALAFAAGFLQAYLGDEGVLTAHVPLALTLVVLVVWVLAWSWTPGARRTG